MDPNNFQHLLVTAASSTIHPFIGYLFSSNSVEVSRLFDNFVFHFNEFYSNCFQAWTKKLLRIPSYEKFTVSKSMRKNWWNSRCAKTLSLRANLCCGNNQNKPINSIANSIRKILRHIKKISVGKTSFKLISGIESAYRNDCEVFLYLWRLQNFLFQNTNKKEENNNWIRFFNVSFRIVSFCILNSTIFKRSIKTVNTLKKEELSCSK